MIEVGKLKTIYSEVPHSLDTPGGLASAKQMKLHVIWKGEWSGGDLLLL